MEKEILDLCEDFWQFQLSESPEFSTYTGYHTGNDKLDTFTVEAYEKRKDFCQNELLHSVERIRCDPKYESTSFENKINLELLHQYLITFVQGLEFKQFLLPYNMYEGVDVAIAKCVISRMQFKSADDFKRSERIFRNFQQQVSDTIELMRTGIREKIMPHGCGMDAVPIRITNTLESEVEDTPYYKPYLNMPESIPKHKQLELQEEGKIVIREFIFKALEEFKQFMSQEYLPSCHTELGVCSLTGGESIYKAMLKFHCDTDLTPVQVHQLGHEQVQYMKERLNTVLRKVNFEGSLLEFFDHMMHDPDSYFDTQEEVINYMTEMLENTIRPKLGKLFKPAPKYDLVISDVVLSAAPVLAEYFAPTPEKPAILYFPAVAVKRLMKCEVACLLLHETEPGHHFQASYMVGQKDLPKFRRHKDDRRYYEAPGRFPLNTAYTEGWGLYCEELGEELGIYNDPYSEFGYLAMRLARAVRVVVDTGIHALRWTRDQACAYMAENCNFNEERRQSEINRYATWPGQACAYTMGHLKIDEIRKKATKKLGPVFDIREFHEVCLKNGQVPLQILEKIVDNYIEKTLGK